MHNYLTLNFSGNMGRVLENLIFLELRTKADSIWYYKTRGKYKVDFLMQDSGENHLIQVCYDLRNINTFSREKKALIAGNERIGDQNGLILTLDEKRVPHLW
jgi:predicted AAA+ superfamily ATPase